MSAIKEPDDSSEDTLHLIGPSEQSVFGIKDTRQRADRLQAELVPKLVSLRDEACILLRDIYGKDALSPFQQVSTPNHRLEAKRTKPFEEATAGLKMKRKAWFFQQRFTCTASTLRVRLFGLRGVESNPIVQVMKEHTDEVCRLLEHFGEYELRSGACRSSDDQEELELPEFIRDLVLVPKSEWVHTYIDGREFELPIDDVEAATPLLYDFVAIFPIFRAATHLRLGENDRFRYYTERFWNWDAKQPDLQSDAYDTEARDAAGDESPVPSFLAEAGGEDSAIEGGFKIAKRRHRIREKRFRERKIRQVLGAQNGRLRCEVPDCGFDYFEVYGELGREFAHVHHKNPLSYHSGPLRTRLDDLAIVCANCHAMIHRGNECRRLEDLIPKRDGG